MIRNYFNCWDFPNSWGTGCRIDVSSSDSKKELNETAKRNSVNVHGKPDTSERKNEKSSKQ